MVVDLQRLVVEAVFDFDFVVQVEVFVAHGEGVFVCFRGTGGAVRVWVVCRGYEGVWSGRCGANVGGAKNLVTEREGGAGTGGRNVGSVWRPLVGRDRSAGARHPRVSCSSPQHHHLYDCDDNYIHDFGYDCAHHHEQTSCLSPEHINQHPNSMRR